MKNKIITNSILFIILFLTFQSIGQNKINSYEYWFDNNFAGKSNISVSPVSELNLVKSIPTTGVESGLHIFHIRFKDDSLKYSTTLSQFFQKLPSSNSVTKQITGYEYWFDDNFAGKISSSVSPQSVYLLSENLDASFIPDGIHIFHIRFRDDGGGWSSVSSQFIQKFAGNTNITNEIKAYEYWFDDNYARKIYQTVTAQSEVQIITSINSNYLGNGLHIFHVRFLDKVNIWSTVLSSFFQKAGSGNLLPNLITAYRYWFNEADSANSIVHLQTPINPYLLNTPLNLSYLHKGNYTIHFQFLDTNNNWSSVTTDTIYKYPTLKANFTSDKLVLCDSGKIIFTNTSVDADTYRWYFGDGDTSHLASPVHFFKTQGTYTVTLTVRDTTVNLIKTISEDILVANNPVINLGKDTSFCTNKSIILDAGSGFTSYKWGNSQTTKTITVSSTGTYSVEVTNSAGCSSNDSIRVFVHDCQGISEQNIYLNINIFPNPNNGMFYLKSYSEVYEPVCISITDISGRIVFKQKNILLLKDELIQVKSGYLDSGIYMLSITSKSSETFRKLIINHN